MPLELRTAPQTPETHDRLIDTINEHAQGIGLPFDGDKLQIEAWDGDTWLGALTGRTHQRWFFVELLAIAPEARGRDVGTALMEEMERLSRARDLIGIWLDTYSFQAPGFYAKLGYEEVGRIPDYPPGHARHFLAKRLDGRPLASGG
jgi:ribosomal protein S18 acetylase RimI-like enzyme